MGFLSEKLRSEPDVPHLAPHHPAFPLEANTPPPQNQWKHQNLTCTKLEGAQPIAQSLSNTSQNPKDPNQVLWSERSFGLLESASRKDICRAETTRDAAWFPDWPDRLSTMLESPFPSPAAHQGLHLRINLVLSHQRPKPQHLCIQREFCRRKGAQHAFCPGILAERDRPNKYHLLFKVQIPAATLNGSIW